MTKRAQNKSEVGPDYMSHFTAEGEDCFGVFFLFQGGALNETLQLDFYRPQWKPQEGAASSRRAELGWGGVGVGGRGVR